MEKLYCNHCGKELNITADYVDYDIDFDSLSYTVDLCASCKDKLVDNVDTIVTRFVRGIQGKERAPRRYELSMIIIEKGYTPIQVASLLGYTQSVVYAWISGARTPRDRDKKRLADLLGVPFERIINIFKEGSAK